MRKKIIALGLALVLAATMFSFTSCDESELGLDAFKANASATAEMYKSMYEGFGALYTENSEKNVASNLELTLKSASNEQFNAILPASLKGNAVYNVSEKKAAVNASSSLFGTDVAANFYVYEGAVYADLGTGTYIKFEAPEGTENIDTDLNGKADTITEGLDALKALLIEKIDSSDFISEKIDIELNGEKVEAIEISLTLDEERLAEIAAYYEEYCADHQEEIQALYEFLKTLVPEGSECGEVPATVEELQAWITALIEKIKAEDIGFDWDYIIAEGNPIGEKITINESGKQFVCDTNYDETETGATGSVKLAVVDADGNEKVIYTITYTLVKGEDADTYTVVFEVPAEKTFRTEMTAVVAADKTDVDIKWVLDDETLVELSGALIFNKTDASVYFNFDGVLKTLDQEYAFQIIVSYDATGDAELVIPEFTEENTIGYESYLNKYIPDYAQGADKGESTIGNGKIDIVLPGFPVVNP